MKRLIDFCLLLLMVFWGSNAWADKTMTFSATSPTNDCNLTQLNVDKGKFQSIENGSITLKITAASDDNASWNTADTGSNHGQTIALKTNAKITISSSSAETKITKIVFHFEGNNKNKGYFTESSTTGGTLGIPTTSYVTTQTWSLEKGASSVSLTNNNKDKAYITSIDIIYQTGGLDNYTVQAYPYTWNFTDDKLWEKSESQFVSEIWKHIITDEGANEWRNNAHEEPTVATGYDVDLLRGLRFTGHVCADRKNKCVSLPRNATITIPSLHKGQKVKINYTGAGILPTTHLEVSQERKDNIEIYKVTQDGNAILTIDDPSDNDVWGVWISQISVLDAAPVLTMTTPYNQDEAPLTTRIILSAKDNDGKDTNIRNNVTATLEGKSADGSQKTHNIGTVTGIANGNKLVFTPKEGQQLRPNYTYTLKLNEKAELQNVEGGKLPDDTFVFTTAKVIGNAPIVESTSPAAESTIKVEDVQPTTSKQIEIKFNEDIQLLDGALIFCRPMGGSESYKSIEYYSANSDNPIHAEGNKLWFDYSGQHLFYGMRYEVTIPTYAIVGKGGLPMEKNFKFYFETPKSAKASDSRAIKDVYTWDFTNISSSTFDEIEKSVEENKTYWGKTEAGKDLEYGSSNAPAPNNRPFAQGQEIKAGNTILPELKGLLFNLVKSNSNRFQIVCKNGSKAKGNTYLYLNGGTHYVTLQSVPAKAMVYIEHNGKNEMFNLNTLGVDSLKTITNSNDNRVSVYQLGNTIKDLTFCVQNCKLYRIAIVKDYKTIGSAGKDYIQYATYSQSYPVDYNLNKSLNGTAVTAYSVSADYQSNATFVNFTELPNNQSASGEGVILKTSGNLGESHPIFTTDVNTTPQKPASNALVGTGDEATKFDDAKKDGYQNYILTTEYFHLDKDENQTGGVIDGNRQCFYKWVRGDAKRNFAYLQLKNPSNANAAKTVIYLDWFGDTTGIHGMAAPSQVTSGKTYYTLDGRKVTSPTQKGIYIINGKKIIIK